jgi:uncharacterized membrane protein YfcA
MTEISWIWGFLIAAATGILSGYGIGGGTLLILILVFFFGAEQSAAQAVNLSYFIPAAGASLFFHVKRGRIDKTVFFCAAIAGTITAAVAAWLAPKIDTEIIKRLFGGILLYVGVRELFAKAQAKDERKKSK